MTADCGTSPNSVFTGTLVPALAAMYTNTGTVQNISCTDVPGTADAILTPADITTLDGVVTQMNAQIQQVAQQNGWAFDRRERDRFEIRVLDHPWCAGDDWNHGREAMPVAAEEKPIARSRYAIKGSSSYLRDGTGTSGFRAAARSVRDARERLH